MIYGLTELGLVTKDFPTITKEIKAELTKNLGQLNFENNSVIGNLVNILSEREVYIWQLCQALYSSMSPDYAEGISLDYNCALLGIKRLPATYSYVTAQITAENYSIIPVQTAVKLSDTLNIVLYNRVEIPVNTESCVGVDLEVITNELESYTLSINNINIIYTKQQTDTTGLIASQLSQLLNNNTELSLVSFVTENEPSVIRIHSKEFKTYFSYSRNEGIKINNVTTNGIFYADSIGNIPIPSDSLRLSSTPNGILNIRNHDAGSMGNDKESDLELRIRRKKMLRLNGRATLNSIYAKLMSLSEVTAVTVNENSLPTVIDNLPPNSFEAVVSGGNDEDIAKAIWEYKPVGIKPYGKVPKDITDSTGKTRTIYFSRPAPYYVFIDIHLTINDQFNTESVPAIKQVIVEEYKTLKLGESLKLISLLGILGNISGIEYALVKLGKNTNPSAGSQDTSSENLQVDSRSILVVEEKRINITHS